MFITQKINQRQEVNTILSLTLRLFILFVALHFKAAPNEKLASPTPENNLLTLPIESWKFKKAKTNIGPLLLGEKKNLVGRIILVSPMSVKTQASFHPKITGWVSVKHASWKVWTQSTDSENVTQISIFYFYCYQLILMPIWRNDSILNPEILKICLLNSRNESVSRKKMNSLPTADFYSLSALPPSQPWTWWKANSTLRFSSRFWSAWANLIPFPVTVKEVVLSFKHDETKQEERRLLWWFSPIFERKFWKASFSPQPKNNNKLCTLKCYRQPSRDHEDQPIWGWSQSWQWCGRDQKMLTMMDKKKPQKRDFPGGPAVKTLHFQCRGCGFNPWGTKIPHVTRHSQKTKQNKMLLERSHRHN